MKLFNKTALAVALASATAVPAVAGDLGFSGGDQTVVLADVIFGNGNPGTGSEETLITAPQVTFDLTEGATVAGDVEDGTAGVATVKFTLGGGAVFGEDLSTTTLVDNANGGSGAPNSGAFSLTSGANVDTALTYEVVQGGAIGDNTITFEITFGADGGGNGETLEGVTFVGYAVKNLTSALNPSSGSKRVQLGVEYVEAPNDFAGDSVATTATDTPLTIFGSMKPFTLTATPNDFTATTRINVGNGEKTFTDANSTNTTFEDGRSDFDSAGDVSVISLGTLQLGLNAAAPTFTGITGNVRKENGDDFDFQGGDTHELSFSVGTGELQVGSSVYLSSAADCSTNAFPINVISAAEIQSFDIAVSGTTTQLTSTYQVCYSVLAGANATTIPEVGQIKATWNVDFFNARYDNIAEEDGNFGDLVRNGCIASFFNIPKSTANDVAYVRLTNTSSTNAGDIRGTLYNEDGSILGTADTTVAPALPTSATQIFSTEAATRDAASGREVVSIEEVFGITADDIEGRARLILKGAFDTCEGLGLMRTGDGSLFNMTATTQGNEAGLPNDGNNGN
ncbi:hypothetical protein DRW07_02565 [Alteromonas sediminis]|uniref:Uncharacterized protein n=1 Tax=Alteromonas sediminis TaxID=2259342 RepID=A0A3N5YA40_9ALTE|nr:hypothetical protein [Alteromonas sediminis]RPJ68309.1 hypothetical protein DRW07_02565 [Alteromonas sediminis]